MLTGAFLTVSVTRRPLYSVSQQYSGMKKEGKVIFLTYAVVYLICQSYYACVLAHPADNFVGITEKEYHDKVLALLDKSDNIDCLILKLIKGGNITQGDVDMVPTEEGVKLSCIVNFMMGEVVEANQDHQNSPDKVYNVRRSVVSSFGEDGLLEDDPAVMSEEDFPNCSPLKRGRGVPGYCTGMEKTKTLSSKSSTFGKSSLLFPLSMCAGSLGGLIIFGYLIYLARERSVISLSNYNGGFHRPVDR